MRTRTRVLLAGTAVVAAAFLVGTSPVGAQDEPASAQEEEVIHEAEQIAEENGATEHDVECIPILVEGGSPDDCQEAPSPILPPTNELVWGSISFAIILLLLWKLAYPGIKKAMDARTERIRVDLERAETAKVDAEGVLTEYQSQLADARNESARIIEEARQTADQVRAEKIGAIDGEIAEMRQRAAADVEAAKAQALADLRGEVTSLALGAAERVVGRNLDDETNRALIDDYIDQVGASH